MSKGSTVRIFSHFVSQDISENIVGKMLQCMSESISKTFEKDKVQDSISSIQKVQSLKWRWFKVSIENVEQLRTVDTVEQNCLYEKDGKYYRVLSIFKKSNKKWRHERIGNKNEKVKVHLQVIKDYYCGYHADEHYLYICEDSFNYAKFT